MTRSGPGICVDCRADTFGGSDKCFMCQSVDSANEVKQLKAELARAIAHGTDEESQKWAAITERDALKAELAQIQMAMQPLIEGTAPTPSLVTAVEAMALGSKMIWDAQKRRIFALREALLTLAPSIAVLSRDDRHHPDTRAEMLRGEKLMLAALLDTKDKS